MYMNEIKNKKYVFVGNREYILRDMLKKDLNVSTVWVIENSYLHHVLENNKFVDYIVISNKYQLLEEISNQKFDILISNGCKYVLPISTMKKATYVNIHPSFLPDLRGKDPINAAILYNRDCGATCHLMDDGIDTGSIISRVKIPITPDIDAALLYQLCFKSEVLAFNEAYQKKFIPDMIAVDLKDTIYFSMKPINRLVDFNEEFDSILNQVRAFGYRSKGLYFKCNDEYFHFYSASEVTNAFVTKYCRDIPDMTVAFSFENSILFKLHGRILRFDQIKDLNGRIHELDKLQNFTDEEKNKFNSDCSF